MPTVHFRNGKDTIVLPEDASTTVPALIAELAEVLVSSQLASQEQVAELKLATQQEEEWVDISHSTSSLQQLGVTDATIIGYAFGDGNFGYESYTPE